MRCPGLGWRFEVEREGKMVIVTSGEGGFIRLFGDCIDVERESGVFGLGKGCIDCMGTKDIHYLQNFLTSCWKHNADPKLTLNWSISRALLVGLNRTTFQFGSGYGADSRVATPDIR